MSNPEVHINPDTGYFENITSIRQQEYPQLNETTYLDHAGTTLYAQSLIDACSQDLKSYLYGNPHSGAESSQRSSRCVEETRLKLLQYFHAPPEHFDVVFTANATAAIKLVAEAFRDHKKGFGFSYHPDCHNSVVGIREMAKGSMCIGAHVDIVREIEKHENKRRIWIRKEMPRLLAFPGQSNLTGYRPDLRISALGRRVSSGKTKCYTLLDAAALVSTSDLDLSDPDIAPDFTALSLYKIFGYPDLGALIVRRESAQILLHKKYFAGGTVDVVTVDKPWSVRSNIIHEALEEGTVPFHNVIALSHALDIQSKIYGSPANVSRHARYLAGIARAQLLNFRHSNQAKLGQVYGVTSAETHGPVIAFNLFDPTGQVFRTSMVEKHAIEANISLRVGGMCNPGGIMTHLNVTGKDVKSLYEKGIRCADDSSASQEMTQPIGMVRVSFGAMSAMEDVDRLLEFVSRQFKDRYVSQFTTTETTRYVELKGSVPQSVCSTSADLFEKEAVVTTAPSKRRKGLRSMFSCFRPLDNRDVSDST